MALADGDPAEPWDVWLRVITDNKYLKRDGTLHNSAFKGKGAIAPSRDRRPWSHEMSGRLLSLIKNLEQDCIDFCAAREFAGVMYQTVENLRSEASGFPTDVIYTPIQDGDVAHADLVVYELTDEQLFVIREWLQKLIRHVRPDGLDEIEALRHAA